MDSDSDFVTYKELRDVCTAQAVTGSQMRIWRERYADFIQQKMVPIWDQTMTDAATNFVGSVLPSEYSPAHGLFTVFLRDQSSQLVTVITENTRVSLMYLMKELGGEQNMTADKMAQFIRPLIGLNEPQTKANKNFYEATLRALREAKETNGLSLSEAMHEAARLARRKAEQQHRYRAMMIARTELANSYNAGAFLAVEDAINQNLLGETVKIWCTSDAERMCEICGRMEGEVRELKDRFSCGVLFPTLHPHCMCAVIYREKWLLSEEELKSLAEGKSTSSATENTSSRRAMGSTNSLETEDSRQAAKIPQQGLTTTLKPDKIEENSLIETLANVPAPESLNSENLQRISGALNPWSDEALHHSEQYYKSVRKMTTDCVKIANNTGVSLNIINTAKTHLFMTKHDLGGAELEYFYPDYEIAQSWQRMILGAESIQNHDIILLHHEKLESHYMQLGYSQQKAHDEANKQFNYALALDERE